MQYAAQLSNNTVVRVIVGTAAWAVGHLGGVWVDSAVKVGTGWEFVDGGLRPPAPEPDNLDAPA